MYRACPTNRLQVGPLSSKTDSPYPYETRVMVEGTKSKPMADQIMTVSKERRTERLGMLPLDQMRGVDMALCVQLGLVA